MQIILLHDVPNIGKKYDIKDVSDGYARNFLIPRKLAEITTSKSIKSAEKRRKQLKEEKEIHGDILEKNIESLEGIKILVEEKANEKGHLFAGIHKEEISKLLKEKNRINIPFELIELEHPIKEVGEHKVKIKNKEIILEVIAKK